jgi:hypothetical protein
MQKNGFQLHSFAALAGMKKLQKGIFTRYWPDFPLSLEGNCCPKPAAFAASGL